MAQKLTKAGEEIRHRAIRCRNDNKSLDTTPRKSARHEFSLDSGVAKLEAAVEKQVALDERRLKFDRERLELAYRQVEDARDKNKKQMELLHHYVKPMRPFVRLRFAPQDSLRIFQTRPRRLSGK